jgi:NTE family protein
MAGMDVGGKKIGLALSGGAARGMAHIGVLRALRHAGIPIHLIAGTSAGAVIGAAYAWNQDVAAITKAALDPRWKRMAPLLDPSFPRTGFIKGKKIKDLLASYIGSDIKFSDLTIPFACVATDIETGEEIVIDSGSVVDALRASISIPGIFTIVPRQGRYLVDGGLTTPVPVETVRLMGADFVIAVNVNPDVADRLSRPSRRPARPRREPNIFQVMMQSIYITTYSLARSSLLAADCVIEPELIDIGAGDFKRARELITRGREAAQGAIAEIKAKLGKMV